MSELTPEERQKIFEEEKARKEAQDKLEAEAKAKDTKQKGIGCLVLIVLLVIIGVWIGSCDGGDQEPRPEHDAIAAYSMSQVFAEDHLKAPSTAKFPVFTEDQVVHAGDGEYIVSSYVDAQNSFGAMVRTHYLCGLKYAGDNKWQLLEFEFIE